MFSKARRIQRALNSSGIPGEAGLIRCNGSTVRRSQQVAGNHHRAGVPSCIHCSCNSAALAASACKRARAWLERCCQRRLSKQDFEPRRPKPSLSVAPYAKAVPVGSETSDGC